MLSMIYLYCFICKRVHLYIIMICTDGTAICICLCKLLIAIGMVHYTLTIYCLWCASMLKLYNNDIFVYLSGVLVQHYTINAA